MDSDLPSTHRGKNIYCKKEQNLKDCPCSWPNCPRLQPTLLILSSFAWAPGICCECIRHHLVKNELPACFFSKEAEKTYDRSIDNFIKDKK